MGRQLLGYLNAAQRKRYSVIAFALIGCVITGGDAGGQTIQGSVRYTGATVEKKKLPVTIDQYVCGKEKDAEGGRLCASCADAAR